MYLYTFFLMATANVTEAMKDFFLFFNLSVVLLLANILQPLLVAGLSILQPFKQDGHLAYVGLLRFFFFKLSVMFYVGFFSLLSDKFFFLITEKSVCDPPFGPITAF